MSCLQAGINWHLKGATVVGRDICGHAEIHTTFVDSPGTRNSDQRMTPTIVAERTHN